MRAKCAGASGHRAGGALTSPDATAGAAPLPAPQRASFRRALGARPFFLLWASQLVSQSGDFVFDVALLWLVLETTGSAFAVGVVVTAMLVPAVVLGPFLGVYVDRWPRRTLLVATNVAQGTIVAALSGLVLAHVTGLGVIVLIVAGLGAGAQVVRIASGALVPQTVPKDDLAPANSLMSFSGSFNQVVGLSVGGVVVALFGVELPIEYDALSFFLAALLVVLIPRAVGAPSPETPGGSGRFRSQFVEGLGFVRGQRFLVEAIALGMVVNFFANAVSALVAPYAAFVLHGGPATYGLLGAAVALGAIVGALAAGKIDTRRHAGKALFAGAAGAGAAIAALGLTTAPGLALGETVALGVALSIANVPILAVVQAKVPGRLMGRVMAVLFSLVAATGPIGAFVAGSFAQATSVETVFLVSGIVILAAEGVGFVLASELRDVSY